MANKKISELNELNSPTISDLIPIVNNGETKKITFQNLKQKSILKAKLTENQDNFAENSQTFVEFNEIDFSFGEGFSLNNHAIVITKDMKAIRLSYTLWVEGASQSYAWVSVFRNNEIMSTSIHDFKEEYYISMQNSDVYPTNIGDEWRISIMFSNPLETTKLAGGTYPRSVSMSLEEVL